MIHNNCKYVGKNKYVTSQFRITFWHADVDKNIFPILIVGVKIWQEGEWYFDDGRRRHTAHILHFLRWEQLHHKPIALRFLQPGVYMCQCDIYIYMMFMETIITWDVQVNSEV